MYFYPVKPNTMKMKRYCLLGFLLFVFSLPAFAQVAVMSPQYCPVPPVDSTLVRGEAARDNLWPGFGTGSRRQADITASNRYKFLEITGVVLVGAGAVGLTEAALKQHLTHQSLFTAKSDMLYVISGGMAAAGVATIVTSRILAVKKARSYDAVIFPTYVPGGAGVGVDFQF